jgi:hypothetical protein
VAFGFYEDRPRGGTVYALYWVDARDGRVLKYLSELEVPGGGIGMPAPVGTPERIGFFSETTSDRGFYVYSTSTQTFKRFSDFWGENFVWQWVAAPDAFTGESSCQP